MAPRDRVEVLRARLLSPNKLQNEVRRRMFESGRGGLIYRARLTDAFFENVDVDDELQKQKK